MLSILIAPISQKFTKSLIKWKYFKAGTPYSAIIECAKPHERCKPCLWLEQSCVNNCVLKIFKFWLGEWFLVFGYGDELVNLLKSKFGVEKHSLVMGLCVILNNTQLITNVTTLIT